MHLALPPLGHVAGGSGDSADESAHLGLVLCRSLVNNGPRSFLVDGHRFTPFVGPQLGNAVAHRLLVVVVLKGRLDGEGVGAGVLLQCPLNVHRRQVAPEGHGTRADDGIQGYAQPLFQVVKAGQAGLENQFGAHNAVVESGVAAGQEDPLGRQVSALEVFFHDKVAVEEVFHVLD